MEWSQKLNDTETIHLENKKAFLSLISPHVSPVEVCSQVQ